MADWDWNPETYLTELSADIPGFEELQDAVASTTAEALANDVLELETGTGETAARVLGRHPGARLLGIDASGKMLAHARKRLPSTDLRVARLEDPLPRGPFDLVFSCLVVHHLPGPGKRDLFRAGAA